MIKSEYHTNDSIYNFTCSSANTEAEFPHSTSEIICEEIPHNVTVRYSIDVYVTSFDNEDLPENCILNAQQFTRELSRCATG